MQVALALVLLIGSGLMIRTFQALRNVDPGFSGASELETVRIMIPETLVKEPVQAMRMEESILRKIETLSGVSTVALASGIPLEGGSSNPVYAEDQSLPEGSVLPIRRSKFISPGYVSAIGSRLIAGRDLSWNDLYNRTPVALISENMARELWRDPRVAVGKRIRNTLRDEWREVIGVVADLHDDGINLKAPSIVYWPLLQRNLTAARDNATRWVAYLIRTPRAGSATLRREIQEAVVSVNSSLPVDVKTLESVYERNLASTSFTLVLLAIAGSMALLLGVVGIYGVVSYSVAPADSGSRNTDRPGRSPSGCHRHVPALWPDDVRHWCGLRADGGVCADTPDEVAAVRCEPRRPSHIFRSRNRVDSCSARWRLPASSQSLSRRPGDCPARRIGIVQRDTSSLNRGSTAINGASIDHHEGSRIRKLATLFGLPGPQRLRRCISTTSGPSNTERTHPMFERSIPLFGK